MCMNFQRDFQWTQRLTTSKVRPFRSNGTTAVLSRTPGAKVTSQYDKCLQCKLWNQAKLTF